MISPFGVMQRTANLSGWLTLHDPDLKLTSLDLSSSDLPFEFEKYLQIATEAVFTRENAEKEGFTVVTLAPSERR